jgi:hypothetical protein
VYVFIDFYNIEQEGFMKTKDEETRHFFKHTSVQVILCPRQPGKNHSRDEYQITVGYG